MSNMSRERRDPGAMKKPETGGTPKKITTKNPPGGPHTPGAKAKKTFTNKSGNQENIDTL
jgi:hypothetical protein